jgi:hypothetical protein
LSRATLDLQPVIGRPADTGNPIDQGHRAITSGMFRNLSKSLPAGRVWLRRLTHQQGGLH